MKQSVAGLAYHRLGDGQSCTSQCPSLSEHGDSPYSGPPLGSGQREVRDVRFITESLLLVYSLAF